ncbi:MAG: beta galactosidase jelly roll domain-containing protein, partial [Tannerella sp.]|nr:beta galactosidase jelly roll domain-containing protein [Tannerella sp.]
MKINNLLAVLLFWLIAIPLGAQVSFGTPEKINEGWKFSLKDLKECISPDFDDSQWQDIGLPHDWSVKAPLNQQFASGTGYLPGGIGWYRKTVHIPLEQQGRKVYLYFEGVYNRSEVFVNGQLLGMRPSGYISFMYDATPHLKFGQDNVIAVRVDHSRSADSRWYTGSGIYRNVWMVYANPVHIVQWGVFAYPQVNNVDGTLNVETEIENGSAQDSRLVVRHELVSPEGKTVARTSGSLSVAARQTTTAKAALKVAKPALWDLEHPVLYMLKTTVLQNGRIIDETVTTTGFRIFTFDPDKGFALNGKSMKMKGVCIHHDAGVLGAAVPREIWRRRLLTLKQVGCNAIRTSHNPQAPDLYELCDELGLLVLNEAFDEWEFAKRKWIEGWNVGTPGLDGSFDFFGEWGERDMADMVRRDRNHVSVFAWSIGNEVDYPNDPYSHPVLDGGADTGFTQPIFGGYKKDSPDAMRLGAIAKRLAGVVRKYDPSRSVTAGLAGVAMSNETEYPAALDIAGYNYTESMYAADHRKYPLRVIYGSENR